MYKFRAGFYADVRIEDSFNTFISYRDGRLEDCREANVKRAFIRVFDGRMWYYSSTGRLEDIQRELDELYSMGSPDEGLEENEIVRSFQVNAEEKLKFSNNCVRALDIETKRVFLEKVSELFQSDYKKSLTASYLDRHILRTFYSSKGTRLKHDFQTAGIACRLGLNHADETFEEQFSQAETSFEALKTILDGRAPAAFTAECENFLLNAVPAQPGSFPVILSPIAAGVFAHESFGHKSEADFMLGDETLKKEWALGRQVGPKELSIYDSGLIEGSGYTPYDDEGSAASKTYLIKDGVLSGRLHSARTAAELKEPVTGNARAVSAWFEPIVRMTTTVIQEGNQSLEQLFSSVKKGYFIKTVRHGSGMSTFTLAPGLCYEIVDGKIGRPVKIAVITGSVFETLGLIDGLSEQCEIHAFVTGGCGKMEQFPLSVGMGGPYVSVSAMNVQ